MWQVTTIYRGKCGLAPALIGVALGTFHTAPIFSMLHVIPNANAACQERLGDSQYTPPACNDTTIVVDYGPGLDTGCQPSSPAGIDIVFEISLPIDDWVTASSGGALAPTARLQFPAYDVDYPGPSYITNDGCAADLSLWTEFDFASINGHTIQTFPVGVDQSWVMCDYRFPVQYLKFPKHGEPPAVNTFHFQIDMFGGPWGCHCAGLDWIAVSFDYHPITAHFYTDYMGSSPIKPVEIGSVTNTAPGLDSVLKICADGENSSLFTFELRSDQLARHSEYLHLKIVEDGGDYASFKTFGDVVDDEPQLLASDLIGFRYSHPIARPTAMLDAHFALVDESPGGWGDTLLTIPFKILCPPVLLVHGLWSSPVGFRGLEDVLLASSGYSRELIYPVNYHGTADRSFATNSDVVGFYIRTLINSLSKTCHAVSKVDVVAHSLGGILSRYYLQGLSAHEPYRGDIGRLVTIDTPHMGSQNADVLLDDANFPILAPHLRWSMLHMKGTDCEQGGVEDLRTQSNVMGLVLNGSSRNRNTVPSSVIDCTIEPSIWMSSSFESTFGFWYIGQWYGLTAADVAYLIFAGDDNDLVVARTSQVAELPLFAQYLVTSESHTYARENPLVQARVKSLLQADDLSPSLTTGGFGYYRLPYFGNVFQRPKKAKVSRRAMPVGEAVAISGISEGQVVAPGDTITMTATGIGGVTSLLFCAGGGDSEDEVSAVVDSSTASFRFVIPQTAVGEYHCGVAAFGNTGSDGFVGEASRTLAVVPTAEIVSLRVDPAVLDVQPGTSFGIDVLAVYSDGYERSLLGLSGIGLSSSNPSVEAVALDSIVAVSEGVSTLTVTYSGRSAYATINAMGNVTGIRPIDTSTRPRSSHHPCIAVPIGRHDEEYRTFFLTRGQPVSEVLVSDVMGKCVFRGRLAAGDIQLRWDYRDSLGRRVPRGIYCASVVIGQRIVGSTKFVCP